MTQQRLARASGVSQSAIASYENADRESSRSLRKLAAALRVEPEWLETGRGPMELPGGSLEPQESTSRPGPMDAATGGKAKGVAAAPWPFATVPPARYDSLNARDKRQLENLVRLFIDACHLEYGAPKGKAHRGG